MADQNIATRYSSKFISGPRTEIVIVDGTTTRSLPYSFDISWKIDTNYFEVNTIDDPMAWELAPQRIAVEGQFRLFHIPYEVLPKQLPPRKKGDNGTSALLKKIKKGISFAKSIMTLDPTGFTKKEEGASQVIPIQSAESLQENPLTMVYTNKYIEIRILDKKTKSLIIKFPNCRILNRSEQISIDQLATISMSFKSIGWGDMYISETQS